MSNISPKLISVEGNRVEYINEEDFKKVKSGQINSNRDPNEKYGDIFVKKWQPESTSNEGRFPTQLFTNIKNDRFKYVKRINI